MRKKRRRKKKKWESHVIVETVCMLSRFSKNTGNRQRCWTKTRLIKKSDGKYYTQMKMTRSDWRNSCTMDGHPHTGIGSWLVITMFTGDNPVHINPKYAETFPIELMLYKMEKGYA